MEEVGRSAVGSELSIGSVAVFDQEQEPRRVRREAGGELGTMPLVASGALETWLR